MDQADLRKSRTLAAALEPVIGQVFFAPECHAAYARLGFAPSPGQAGLVHLPDGPAYFTSRGSLMGQVRPGVVAAAFGVFKPEIATAGVTLGWSLTDAADDLRGPARGGGRAARARARRGRHAGVDRASVLLERAVAVARLPGARCSPGCVRGGTIRPTRGRACSTSATCCANAAATRTSPRSSTGLDGVEIGLLNDVYMGLPLRSYVRTRGWSEEDLAAGVDRLRDYGWLDGDDLSDEGRAVREEIERATDLQMEPALDVLGDDLGELVALLTPWGVAMREAGGYVGGPVDLWPVRDD